MSSPHNQRRRSFGGGKMCREILGSSAKSESEDTGC